MTTGKRGESYYRVVDRIATGGMAEVFRGETYGLADFQKSVAIKRVLPSLASNERFVRMFLDEARLSARLDHKNIVQVFDVGRADDTYFIVMEYVDGVTLKQVMEHTQRRGRTLAVPLAVHIAIEMCSGLGYAHQLTDAAGNALGIVHRDISPSNVLIARSGGVKIVDFGVAKAAMHAEKTDPGVVKGKLGYLSPEVAEGGAVDATVDLYATGIVLWEMLAGRALYQAPTDYETLQLVRAGEVPGLTSLNPAVPAALDRVVRKALARDKAERYPTAGAMSRALTQVLFDTRMPVNSEDLGALVREVIAVASGGESPRPGESVNSVIGIQGQIFVPPAEPIGIESLVGSDRPPARGTPPRATRATGTKTSDAGGDARAAASSAAVAATSATAGRQGGARGWLVALAVLGLGAGGVALAATRGLVPGLRMPGSATDAARAAGGRTVVARDAAATHARANAGDDDDGDERGAGPTSAATTREGDAAVEAGLALAANDAGAAAAAAAGPELMLPGGPRPYWPEANARASVLLAVQQQVYACAERYGRHARTARVVVAYEGLTGRVLSYQVLGTYFPGRPIGDCVEEAVRAHPIAPFRAPRWQTMYDLMVQ